jgi:hypothetical protein
MSKPDERQVPIELQAVSDRLAAERPWATDLELDRIKLKALAVADASRPVTKRLRRSGRLASVALAVVLMAGGGAVLAQTKGPSSASSTNSASNSQYCPPTSQSGGKPKDPGPAKCGQPKTK